MPPSEIDNRSVVFSNTGSGSTRSVCCRGLDGFAQSDNDLTFAADSCNNLITNLLASCEPLPDIRQEAEAGLAFARKIRFGLVIDIITSKLRLILTLRGVHRAAQSCLPLGASWLLSRLILR
jgi:hypothetical protein